MPTCYCTTYVALRIGIRIPYLVSSRLRDLDHTGKFIWWYASDIWILHSVSAYATLCLPVMHLNYPLLYIRLAFGATNTIVSTVNCNY